MNKDPLDKELLEELYIKQNLSIKTIQRKLKISRGKIKNWLKYHNIPVHNTKAIVESTKQTNLERYGVDNPQKNPDIHNKTIETCLKLYGSISSLGNPDIIIKKNKTLKQKYGTTTPILNFKI